MQKHWKKIVAVVIALAVLVVAGSFIYAKFINKADDEFDSGDVKDRLTTTTVAGGTATTGGSTPSGTRSRPTPRPACARRAAPAGASSRSGRR